MKTFFFAFVLMINSMSLFAIEQTQAEKFEILYQKNTETIREIAKLQTQINKILKKQSNASGVSVLGILATGYSGGILIINRLYQNKMLSTKSLKIAGTLAVVGILTTAAGEKYFAMEQKALIQLKEALNAREHELKMQNDIIAESLGSNTLAIENSMP
jgi:deoxycytidylate deaminase